MDKTVLLLAVLLFSSSSLATSQDVDRAIDSVVKGEATAKSGSFTELKKSVNESVTAAVKDSCKGNVTAVGQALAVAVARASAKAWAKTKAKVEVVGTGKGCAAAKATAVAVSQAIADAYASTVAVATDGCEAFAAADGEASSTKSAVATAIAEASAAACSTGGVAEATADAVAKAVVRVTASAYVEMVAKVRTQCNVCSADEPADSPAPIDSPAPSGGEPAPQDTVKPEVKPEVKPADKLEGPPPISSVLLEEPANSPAPKPAAKPVNEDVTKSKVVDKVASPAPAAPAASQEHTTLTGLKYKICDKPLKTNGCCGGKGFDAKGTACKCTEFNGRRFLETCRFSRVSDDAAVNDLVWQDKYGGAICSCTPVPQVAPVPTSRWSGRQ